MRRTIPKDDSALTVLVMIACDSGIRTDEEFQQAMEWIGGEDWMNTPPKVWLRRLAEVHDVYIEKENFGEALTEMFQAYKERKIDANPS